ncbi:Flp family type IVb pilin [Tessaracoccus sp. MC1627]|uniref:Flp family type IVb pilin n=1 Tax=Tessaracoccus sp. MC1627 TaxID=2760312 RepID=UPI00351C7154
MIEAENGESQPIEVAAVGMSSERGATAVEYAIMASLIGAVVVTTVTVLGTRVAALFQSVLTAMGW